ncbi:DUF6465 family protein [Oribacterium sp. WCC10]|uniref:DUF6465 family protein n=1 Tax=Oribacterium sp. WCC10 TaxID=1855343 RepID=UPI0008F05280|nr:DUF6465 family protein [Oribacterium sp. WCC10]SFG10253.1 hypothetical protein SAMN05216356_101260 [Oribacterium sp. WCC10]
MEEVNVIDPVTAEVAKDEKTAKTTPKKRGPKPKKDTTPKKRTTRAKKDAVVEAKKPVAEKKAPAKKAAPAQKFNFTRTVFEFNKMQFTEDTINKKVLDYLEKHPYIHAEKIETFVNLEEGKVYFTVDGYGNPDFSISL